VKALAPNGVESAKSAGLRYVSDAMRATAGSWSGKTFRYLDTKGHVIRSAETLRRIQRLAIPPAWTEVWICPIAEGHLQALGRDARGRKQYRYHPDWRVARDQNQVPSHGRVCEGAARNSTSRCAGSQREASHSKARFLRPSCGYWKPQLSGSATKSTKKHNDSFGLTTLQNRHVNVRGSEVRFYFRGKKRSEAHHRS
jgi:DNA topoisomerase-1